MMSAAVHGEHLANVGFFAFSLAFASDSPKSHAVDSDGLIPAIRPNSKNPSKNWESCPSISQEAVARCHGQNLRSSRPNGDASFLVCLALVQRKRQSSNGGLPEVQLSARQHAIVGHWLFALPHGSGATAPLKGKLDLNGGLSSCSTHPYQGYPSIRHCEHRYGFMQVNHCQSERIVIGLSDH